MFIQDWQSRLDFSSRASLYRNLSFFCCYKTYLDSISVVKFRIVLTTLRIAAHRLLIETGSWINPKPIALENRKWYGILFILYLFVPYTFFMSCISV